VQERTAAEYRNREGPAPAPAAGRPQAVAGIRVEDYYDNALTETIIGLFKTEATHPRGPRRTVDDVEPGTLEWVHGFNHRRLLEPIGDIPPAELEQSCYRQQQGAARAA
jgi:putative transposase